MQFGLRLADWFGGVENLVELAILAEKNGFDYCWVSHDVFMRSSLVALTAIGKNTKRMKLGNTILNPYTMNPAEIAMYLATLDEMTNGRVVCGISAGALEYMDWLGIPHRMPLTRTREAVNLIRSLIAGKTTEFDGKEFKWSAQCYMRFKPFRPKIPIYIGGQGDKMLEYSGEEGDGALPILYPPEFSSYAAETIRAGARKAGRDPAEVDIAGCVWLSVAKRGEDAVTPALKELIAYFGPLLGAKGLAAVGLTRDDFAQAHEIFKREGIKKASETVNEKMLRLAIYGSPDDCIERLNRLERAGINQVLIGAPLGPDPKKSIEILGKEVIPHFK